ncbi:MAG TPA: hypothetical protein PK228_05865 [Saprospiraceae bacterium]|nr:hypothetical protein [Saprospiraceae bacterium]
MFFYIDFRSSSAPAIQVAQLANGEELPVCPDRNILYAQAGKQRLMVFDVPGGKFLLLGDPVFVLSASLFGRIVPEAGIVKQNVLYQEIKGHYYWFFLPESASANADVPAAMQTRVAPSLLCGNSFGAIYPVYYAVENDRIIVSSSSRFLAEKTNAVSKDKRNLLERLLFNYPFFNSTWWSGIQLLEAHRYLKTDRDGISVAGDFEISDHFGAPEDSSRDSLPGLVDLFQKETELFFPDEPFAISLTGGFDGRTLVAAAKKANRNFFAYSFGRPDSTDVTMPAAQAARLRIPYYPIHLDDRYIESHSLESAWNFMRLTEYNGNFGRPHYHYAARALAEKTNYILTGNFGSELFRALHLPGVMMSDCLIRVFSAQDNSWKDFLKQRAESWDIHFFQYETDALIADIEKYLKKMNGWEANHKFYHFVFSEIFRKYFGPELVMQSTYLNNRTPYLNLHFFRELNKTIWSGVHARLFEKVKSKRMKGQMFYATFIRRADPKLYHLKTNKGYSPSDVLESIRLPLLAGRVVWHKYLNNKEIDDNSVHAFIRKYHRQITGRIAQHSPDFFQSRFEQSFQDISDEKNIENLVKFFSIAAGWEAAGNIIGATALT